MSVELFLDEDWIKREMAVGAKLAQLGLPAFDQSLLERACKGGATPDYRFVPAGLGRRQLLEACCQAGIKVYRGNAAGADYDGDKMPTELGVLTLNYADIFMPDHDGSHRPFMLGYNEQSEWAVAQGGDGIASAEESLYAAVLRPWVELGYLPYMGGSIRCRNACGSDSSLYVVFNANDGLDISYWDRPRRYWTLWALPRKWQALGT